MASFSQPNLVSHGAFDPENHKSQLTGNGFNLVLPRKRSRPIFLSFFLKFYRWWATIVHCQDRFVEHRAFDNSPKRVASRWFVYEMPASLLETQLNRTYSLIGTKFKFTKQLKSRVLRFKWMWTHQAAPLFGWWIWAAERVCLAQSEFVVPNTNWDEGWSRAHFWWLVFEKLISTCFRVEYSRRCLF